MVSRPVQHSLSSCAKMDIMFNFCRPESLFLTALLQTVVLMVIVRFE